MEKPFIDNPQDDRLEFNDGVGDMLRPKEKSGFGWFSTVLIVGLSLIVILLSFWISFNVGKKIFLKESTPEQVIDQNVWDDPSQKDVVSDGMNQTAELQEGNESIVQKNTAEELLPPDKPVAKAPSSQPAAPARGIEPARQTNIAKIEAPAKPAATPKPPVVKKAAVAEAVVADVPAPTPKKVPVAAAAKPKPVVTDGTKLLKVVAGSFADRDGAKALVAELAGKGVSSFIWTQPVSNKTIYRIQVGAFQSSALAEAMIGKLKSLGYDAYILQQ